MSNSKSLIELLARNKVDIEIFNDLSYTSLLISLLEVIINQAEVNGDELKIKKRVMSSENKEITVQNLVRELTNCEISVKESSIILEYLIAYFNKSSTRKPVSTEERIKILKMQANKCSLCTKQIDISNVEIDHIIPFKYVGDELGGGNLQGLCRECNRKKSRSINFNLRMFLIRKV
jgi:5-methylcytosine-specific restriction endonuclease McrA